jgi:dCMP deaminase
MKPKFIDAHMKVAETYSQLSSAKRLQVGCVIVKNDTIIGIGYNGMPSGWTNECEDILFVQDDTELDYETMTKEGYTFGSYKDFSGWTKRVTKPEVIHAEINAISKVARSNNSSEDADMFITHAPCIECAKSIFQSGIRRIFYKDTYRSEDGINFLQKCDVEVIRV